MSDPRPPHYDQGHLTVEQVEKVVDAIEACAGDPEGAHSMEDDLYRTVLRAIAEERHEEGEARWLAEKALQTRGLDFPRWMA